MAAASYPALIRFCVSSGLISKRFPRLSCGQTCQSCTPSNSSEGTVRSRDLLNSSRFLDRWMTRISRYPALTNGKIGALSRAPPSMQSLPSIFTGVYAPGKGPCAHSSPKDLHIAGPSKNTPRLERNPVPSDFGHLS